ncbi:hypothetical protein RBA41_18035 [Massilia sp. CCM 9210]|uniref:hypothetical protein n=1 Tax=Massilia scottii TaxID=3057166 RepID=UPI002796819A|nr:hypothetical protein [Massilia sp. CCM 9210]MDQ1815202.1 hypothetical protein [Massilia sp. CCM 9210]
MSTIAQITLANVENQAFALMSRLHVILRRGQGRVTDIEYMHIDPAYCRHVPGLANATGNDDVRQISACKTSILARVACPWRRSKRRCWRAPPRCKAMPGACAEGHSPQP